MRTTPIRTDVHALSIRELHCPNFFEVPFGTRMHRNTIELCSEFGRHIAEAGIGALQFFEVFPERFRELINHFRISVLIGKDHLRQTKGLDGFILTIVGISETAVAGYKVIMTANNIHEKKEQNQLKASLHEEVQQILKDAIRKAGE